MDSFEMLQSIITLQFDISVHGCTEHRRERMYKLLKKFLPIIGVDPTDENIQACWYEG